MVEDSFNILISVDGLSCREKGLKFWISNRGVFFDGHYSVEDGELQALVSCGRHSLHVI